MPWLMLLNVFWILPIQAVSCNYIVKQGLFTRGNKVYLWEGPQTSHCLYNRNCWRPFSSCWQAYRHMHTCYMPLVGIPKAHSNIQYFCSHIKYFMRHRSPGTLSCSHPHGSIPGWQRHPSARVSREARQAFLINTVVFISCTTSL